MITTGWISGCGGLVPDVIGLRAFYSREPIYRMLPGQFPN